MSDTKQTNTTNDEATVVVKGNPEATKLHPEVPETLNVEKRTFTAFEDNFKHAGRINIRPYIDNTKDNMGLQNYGMAVFPGIHHEEQLAAIEQNGVVRYVTGLDEFAPEVQLITNDEQREAVIHNIRSIVSYLEKMLATNVVKVEDPEFWNKVKLLRPDNHKFWGQISIRCGNEPVFLDPAKDPFDLIKLMAIEAGGFDIIAKSYDDALAQSVAPKFYLDKEAHTVSSRTEDKKIRNKAVALLDKLSNGNPTKLLYITKTIDSNSASYKHSTPVDILYDVLDDYINGKGVEASTKKAAEHFMDVANQDMETLKLRALVKDASFYKVISLKADGMLYHTRTASMLGRNVSDVVIYLKNPLNEDMLVKLMTDIEPYWKA
jgi:hypothetical protein